jgi:hypothetical protein
MFEILLERVARTAEQRARARRAALAERLAAQLPADIAAEAVDWGVQITGPGLARRFALDPGLRWIAGRLA